MSASPKHHVDTRLTHGGSNPHANYGVVNPPVYHASTILFETMDVLRERLPQRFDVPYYGRAGVPTTWALEEAVADIENGHRAVSLPSGLAAITAPLMAYVKAGDHILVTDSVYAPTRIFCEKMLRPLGIETEFYDPLIGAGISDLIRNNTRVVFMEAPGSHTFEMQDVPTITAAARDRGVTTMIDNTWASPLFFKPLDLGVDVSIHAGTKYIVGHSDAMLGMAICTEESFLKVKTAAAMLGFSMAPDDAYLALRGLRTLSVRLERHQRNALIIARWLQQRPEVDRVLYPALPEDPGHEIWKRDFTGATGLMGMVLKPVPRKAVDALADRRRLFGIGFSWGGYESLILPTDPRTNRTAIPWTEPGPLVRLHIGLEDPEDLKQDLEEGFAAMTRTAIEMGE